MTNGNIEARAPTPAEQFILNKLKNIPDHGWLLMDCHTKDQREHWSDCRLFYELLRKLLKDWFSGQETYWFHLPKADRDFWVRYRDQWIALYDLLQLGYSAVREGFARDGLDLPANSPGEMLILILEWQAAGLFFPCTEYASPRLSKFSPQSAHRAYRQSFKAMSAAESLQQISREEFQFTALLNYCLAILSKESKKDRLVKEKLRDYLKIEARIDEELYSGVHPRKGAQGHQWVNGKKMPLRSKRS